MKSPTIRQRWWSRWIGAAIRWIGVGPSEEELRRAAAADWRTDTGAMGLRFSERLRDIYRRRWLRLRR